ncbi:MAG: hypothetical protein ABIE74_02165 [Pseudomonadota bacterium]
MREEEVGYVEHWFGHLNVAGIKITNGALKVGDKIHIKGHTSDFTITVTSMQVEHDNVQVAPQGSDIGITVPEHARIHDKVYKVLEEE